MLSTMSVLESITLVNLKRCPDCNNCNLNIINLFSVKDFEERGYIDLFCPQCMSIIEKDKYGRTMRITKHGDTKKDCFKPHFSLRARANIFLPSPKTKPFNAFLVKRSDFNE